MNSGQAHVLSGGPPQTNMMNRRLADQGHGSGTINNSQMTQQQNNQQYHNQAHDSNAIMGISGGMVRLKGNSPKVSGKDSNRPRTIK